MNEEKKGGFWFGFILGGFFGITTLLLTRSKEGKNLIKTIFEKGEILEEEFEEIFQAAEEKGGRIIGDTEKFRNEVAKKLNQGKKILTEKISEETTATLTKIGEEQKKFFKKNGKKLSS